MKYSELIKEQVKLAAKLSLQDGFTKVKTLGGACCLASHNEIIASVVVCDAESLGLLEHKTYVLPQPFPYQPGLEAYREMPAIMEAFNLLSQEPDVLLVQGPGVNHPRKVGIAAHLGLALNVPTIGISESLLLGRIEQGKIMVEREIRGFEIKTKEYARPIYAAPGHLMSLGSTLHFISKTIKPPHKMPEPLHLAHSLARKKVKGMTVLEAQNLALGATVQNLATEQQSL